MLAVSVASRKLLLPKYVSELCSIKRAIIRVCVNLVARKKMNYTKRLFYLQLTNNCNVEPFCLKKTYVSYIISILVHKICLERG